jgi:tRNA (guanine-N7-)-methyltransferase
MSKPKLEKFAEIGEFPNVYQNWSYEHPQLVGPGGEEVDLRGAWGKRHFENDKPITLELACGRGEYTVGLARRFPDRNFLGVDIKGNRIWFGARQALDERLPNAAFLRTDITQLHEFVAEGEIAEIWITHPDPHLRACKAGKRLTAPRYLDMYRRLGGPGVTVHLKTDEQKLYAYSLESVTEFGAVVEYATHDIDAGGELPIPELGIPTYYERMHRDLGKSITYLRFRL